MDGLAYSFSTFAISIACLHLGSHISSLPIPLRTAPRAGVPNTNGAKESSSSTTHYPKKTPLLDILTIISAFLSYLIAILLYFLAPSIWRHRATFPLLLAPPGAILRFFLARLNTRHIFIDRFPLGTFLANMIATLVISGVFAAQRQPGVTSRFVTCNALYAIQEGFCGCLSTVSTLAIESRAIKGVWWKWIYVGGSVVLGHILVLVIVGGTRWGEGYSSVCQGSFG